ncbi:MAG TPA: DUF3575 domain-containing protein [Candidatus Kapabacteria bacterium]
MYKNVARSFGILVALCLTLPLSNAYSQTQDPTGARQDSMMVKIEEPPGKNTIRFMLSDYLIWGNTNIVVGYERAIDDRFTVVANIGGASLPKLFSFSGDSVVASNESTKFGFHASLEGRYYITTENKYSAPRGVFAGAFLSHNSYGRDVTWTITHSDGGPTDNIVINTDINLSFAGVELGYQFILFDHLAIDMVLVGLGVGRYSYSAKADVDIQNEDTKAALDAAQESIRVIFPNFSFFKDIANGISGAGTSTTFAPGLRYIISLGWNF